MKSTTIAFGKSSPDSSVRVRASLALLAAGLSCSLGCESSPSGPWETKTHGDQLYVLNKVTGEMHSVQDSGLKKIVPSDSNSPPPPAVPKTEPIEEIAREHRVADTLWIMGDRAC